MKILLTTLTNIDAGVCMVKNSEYDHEIPQSQTAENPMAPRGRAAQPSRDTRKVSKGAKIRNPYGTLTDIQVSAMR